MNFRDVYDAMFPFVWRTLRRLGVQPSDVADATQEVFLIVHRRLPEFEGRARLTTWLFRICYRTARDRGRLAYVRHEVMDPNLVDSRSDERSAADDVLQRRQDLELLDMALDNLDLEQRAVFTLFELEEMTGDQIAETLEIPLGTVYSRLRLARIAFKKAVRRELARRHGSALLSEGMS